MKKILLLGYLWVFSTLILFAQNTPPDLTADADTTVDSDIVILFTDIVEWENVVSPPKIVTISDTTLTVGDDYDFDYENNTLTLKPGGGKSVLQKVGEKTLIIEVDGYDNASVIQTIAHGVASQLAMKTQAIAPSINGEEFDPQPEIDILDQYGNLCASDGARTITAAKADAGSWILGGTLAQDANFGTLTFSGLTASSNVEITGGNISFSATDLTGVTSSNFNLELNTPPDLTAASGATVDNDFEISYGELVDWESSESLSITFDGIEVPAIAYTINSTSNKILFKPSEHSSLQKAQTANIIISVDGYSDASVSQILGHGVATHLAMDLEPVAPLNNGDLFQDQPVVSVRDQYDNICSNNNSISITAEENDPATWKLLGGLTGTVISGVLSYSDLAASSTQVVENAYISFTASGLTGVSSATFNLALNSPPDLTADADATVDGTFVITFTDIQSWHSKISSITYDGNTIEATAYDTTVVNQITFDPFKSTILQVAGSGDIVISADGFTPTVAISQTIGHGVPDSIYFSKQPTAPSQNGGLLAIQPEVRSLDQYGNNCTGDNVTIISVVKGDSEDWTLGGSPNQTLTGGVFAYIDLSATSDVAVSEAYLTISSGSFEDVSSESFDIPVNDSPVLSSSSDATVDNDFFIEFTDDATWRDKITDVKYGGASLPALAYDTGEEGRITLKPTESSTLQDAGSDTLTFIASGYSDAKIFQNIGHGLVSSLYIKTQPVGPTANGSVLDTQPVVQLYDQYSNVCTSNSTAIISAEASGGDWNISGTINLTAVDGEFNFTDLIASSDSEITDASITFSSSSLDNVVTDVFTVPALEISPTLFAASDATVDNTFEVTFANNPSWRSAIDSITYGRSLISGDAYNNTQQEKIIFDPSKDADLQLSGLDTIRVYASTYETASVPQEIKHGAASEMVIVLQPASPAENGGVLATQPGLTLRDQYGNDCINENAIKITAAKGDPNEWSLGGTVTKTAANGSVSYTDLTAGSNGPVTGAFISFSATDLTTVNSNAFDIPDLNAAPVLTAATDVTVDADFEITFTDNVDWRTQITEIKYGNAVLSTTAYDTTEAGKITFKPAEDIALQTSADDYIFISSSSFLKDSIQQNIDHGVATGIVITSQPEGPDKNGDLLKTQPEVKIQDQYNNDCTTNNLTIINANASGGSWDLEGTDSLKVTNGVASYDDLTAGSTVMLSDATITFSGTGLTNQESDTFIIPAPLVAPSLIASANATVDSPFDVTSSENSEWQGNIDSVSYAGNILPDNAYDKSQAGKIVFDPAQDVILQLADTKELVIFSRGYENATLNQEIKHGQPDTLLIETQPTAPLVNGGVLDLQPKISLKDQYNNNCDTESTYEVLVIKGDESDWILEGDTLQAVSDGVINYRSLSASSTDAVTGAYLTFTGEGIISVDSDPFDIPNLQNPPSLTAQVDATVDADFEVDIRGGDDSWASEITMITYQGDTLPDTAYDIESEKIIFHVSEEILLQTSGVFNIVFKALGYSDASVEQTVGHGLTASMLITQQPLAPIANGDLLEQQPALEFYDQYSNLCDTDNEKTIIVSRNDTGEWTLDGTVEKTAVNGLVTFEDLSAYSTAPVTGAQILFNSADLDAVVSDVFDIPDVALPPVLTAAASATVDKPFKITFAEDSVWRNRINVVTVKDSILPIESYNFSQVGELELIPSASSFLQKSGSFEIIVQSRGFSHDTVQQDIQHGIADSLLILVQPTAPESNGDSLANQPELKLVDQYLNDCITDNSTLVNVEKYDNKAWDLSGALEVQSAEGLVDFTDLVASSEIAIDSAYLQFYFAADSVISNLFAIPVPVIELIAAENVTVDEQFSIQTSDNSSWRDSISAVSYAGETLADTAYLIEAGKITFYPQKDSILQIARTDTIVVYANAYADARVEQFIGHGVTTEMLIVDQPLGPENNGDTLSLQPKIQLQDQYKNNCETDNTTQVLVEKYSDESDNNNSEQWDLGGEKTISSTEGVVQFTNLTASSEDLVIGARLLFTSENLPNVVSDSFDIVRPLAPIITPAANANVDEQFVVTFTDNKSWREQIFDIRYGIRSLEGNYDISVPGQISFDPSVTSILQQYGVDSMYVYSGSYDTTRFEQPIHHGKSKYLVISKEPSPPTTNGGEFIRQPQLVIQDQYRNMCDTDSESPVTVRKADLGEWTLSGTLTQVAVNGEIIFVDLAATSEMEVRNAKMEFEGTGLISKMSQTFTIPEPKTNRAGEANANPELVCYGAKSNITLVGFDGDIQWQIYNELDDKYEDLDGENSELLVTSEIVKNEIYRAMVSKSGFATQYSNAVSVSPIEPPVADFSFEIDYNQVHFTNLSVNASSILWDFGDGILSSEFEVSHSYVLESAEGSGYVVSLTASNVACPDSKKSQQIFITTGIDDLNVENKLVVYPNPNRGDFFVEISAMDEDGILRIFNSAGKIVMSKEIKKHFSSERLEFDLKDMAGGFYFLTIQYPDKVIRTKLIITK
ncbi:hemoblobin-interacting domain-containing protein [Marinifilum sp. RC60d5]|uniref:hemoblobin-interacting domain-containing protein n=1 Tax=Marinifilum sp. RC60d5 TaxID=3458414 RepID=UPI0040361B21